MSVGKKFFRIIKLFADDEFIRCRAENLPEHTAEIRAAVMRQTAEVCNAVYRGAFTVYNFYNFIQTACVACGVMLRCCLRNR